MIVNGFCRQVFKELPMEFAVEAQKLLSVSLEGVLVKVKKRDVMLEIKLTCQTGEKGILRGINLL